MYQNKTEELLAKKQAEAGLRNNHRKQSGILLYVRTWAGEVVTLNLGDSLHHATVAEVKHRIFNESEIKIPVEDQLLLFQGREMDDDRTVISYGWLVFILCVHLTRRHDDGIPSLNSSLNLEELREIADKEAAQFVAECKKNGNEDLLIENGFYYSSKTGSSSSSADASTVASSHAVTRSNTKTRRFSDSDGLNSSSGSKHKSNFGGVLRTDDIDLKKSNSKNEENLESSTGSNLTETVLRSEIFSNGDQFVLNSESNNANDYVNKNDRFTNLSKISEEDKKSATNTNSSQNTSRRASRQNSYMRKGSKENIVIVSASDIMSKVNSLSREGSVYSSQDGSEVNSKASEADFMRNFRQAYDTAWKSANHEGAHEEMSPIWEHVEPNAEPSPMNNDSIPGPPSKLPSDFCEGNEFLRTVSKRLEAELADVM